MTTQLTFGIEDLTGNEILQLSPRRVDRRALRRLRNGPLLRLRNIVRAEQDSYQTLAQARTLSDRLSRIEEEMDRRGLSRWLEKGCEKCGNPWRVFDLGDGSLGGNCACTDALNGMFQPR